MRFRVSIRSESNHPHPLPEIDFHHNGRQSRMNRPGADEPAMFRIKTDVRQYTCESRDKVVRLIRNWVIRPSDVIYNREADEWEPIGEHPEFVETFREMEKAEEGVAETVVTPDVDETEAADAGAVEGEDEAGDGDQVTGGDEETAPSSQRPDPPTAPEGVTSSREYADSDEITVMTEETLDSVLEDQPEGDGEANGEISAANRPDQRRDDLSDDVSDQGESVSDESVDDEEPLELDEVGEEVETDEVTSREDLPEEVFATDRMDKKPFIEETSAGDGSDAPDNDRTNDPDAGPSSPEDSDAEEWDEILQKLRDTDELDGEELDRIEETREEIPLGRDEPRDEEPTDQTAEYYGASGGYDWEPPDYVAPTEADWKHGLTAESVSDERKDGVFPYPGPKQKGEVQTRTFSFGDSSESGTSYRRVAIGAAVAVAVGILTVLVLSSL